MLKAIKAGLVGGIILFIWGYVSWMVLPWHMATLHGFTVEKAVSQSIKSNAPTSGIYLLPIMHHQESNATAAAPEEPNQEPIVFASVNLQGMHPSMAGHIVISFFTQFVAACLVAWLLLRAYGSSYLGRLCFVVIFALAAGTVTHVPYWNWFGFDLQYTLIEFADLLIGWFLAGLVMAKLCKTNK